MPQVSIQLKAGAKIVWNAREDVDDMMMLARSLFRICIRTLSRLEEHRDVQSSFIERMNTVIRETEEIINQLKALPILSAQTYLKTHLKFNNRFCHLPRSSLRDFLKCPRRTMTLIRLDGFAARDKSDGVMILTWGCGL